MMEVNDEKLNSYFDGDLSPAEKEEVLRLVRNSPELKKQFEALKQAHDLLSAVKQEELSENFSSLVMSKLNVQRIRMRQQKKFLITIVSFFVIIILSISGFLLYNVLISASHSAESSDSINSLSSYIRNFSSFLFSKSGTTLIGSALSFIMLVSGYFLFEYQKKEKTIQGR